MDELERDESVESDIRRECDNFIDQSTKGEELGVYGEFLDMPELAKLLNETSGCPSAFKLEDKQWYQR
jgi:hypothetical protein